MEWKFKLGRELLGLNLEVHRTPLSTLKIGMVQF